MGKRSKAGALQAHGGGAMEGVGGGAGFEGRGDGAALRGAQRGAQRGALVRARGLGWFSVALGLSEVVAPRLLARAVGVYGDRRNRWALRALGARELTAGVGILVRPRPVAWLLSRFVGDFMDLGLLGAALFSPYANKKRVAGATAAVLGVTVLDAIGAAQLARKGERIATRGEQPIHVQRSTTINRSSDEIYAFWRDFENLPRFMAHLQSVKTQDGFSHWIARAPGGGSVEWDAVVTEERPGELIAWRSLEGAVVSNSGSVRFVRSPGGRGTEVHVEIDYRAPGGKLGAALAKLLGEEPGQQVEGDLRRLKQVIETGEVTQSDASVRGGPKAAQPGAKEGEGAFINGTGKRGGQSGERRMQ